MEDRHRAGRRQGAWGAGCGLVIGGWSGAYLAGPAGFVIGWIVVGFPIALWYYRTGYEEESSSADFRNSQFAERNQRYGSSVQKFDGFTVEGPWQFQEDVKDVLTVLRTRAPKRYKEVKKHFNTVRYDPHELRGRNVDALSSGVFAMDSTTRGRDWFRHVFLHEAGHEVLHHLKDDYSQESADAYAYMVEHELGW